MRLGQGQVILLLSPLLLMGCDDKKCDRNLREVWQGDSCSMKESEVAEGDDGLCHRGINNTLCQLELVEESVWATDERALTPIVGEKTTFRAFYKFIPGTNRWEHYLFQDTPYFDQHPYEVRSGVFEIHTGLGGDYLSMNLEQSSCAGQISIFSIFDAAERNANIGRNDSNVALLMPATFTEGFGVKIDEYKEHFVAAIYTFIYDLVWAPFSLEYWQAVVTGAYRYSGTTKSEFTALLANGLPACLSPEGVAAIQDQIEVPANVKILLDQL